MLQFVCDFRGIDSREIDVVDAARMDTRPDVPLPLVTDHRRVNL
jgi:hypothetical protein